MKNTATIASSTCAECSASPSGTAGSGGCCWLGTGWESSRSTTTATAEFLAFASEIKSLLEIPSIPREVDPEALDLYLSLRYVPGPRTMFKNIFRLQPGHILVVDDRGRSQPRNTGTSTIRGPGTTFAEAHLSGRFSELLEESVRMRLISEVPLGVFLSGGLDSSAILATMSKPEPTAKG